MKRSCDDSLSKQKEDKIYKEILSYFSTKIQRRTHLHIKLRWFSPGIHSVTLGFQAIIQYYQNNSFPLFSVPKNNLLSLKKMK